MGLIIKGRRALMIHNTRGKSRGKFNFPGGHFEPGESREQCLIREVQEETGLAVNDYTYPGRINFFNGNTPDWILHVFMVNRFSGRIKESDEGALVWFDTAMLPLDRMWPSDRLCYGHQPPYPANSGELMSITMGTPHVC